MSDLTEVVKTLSEEIALHTHISPFMPSTPLNTSPPTGGEGTSGMMDTMNILLDKVSRMNASLANLEMKYLNPAVSIEGGGYILSDRNKVN